MDSAVTGDSEELELLRLTLLDAAMAADLSNAAAYFADCQVHWRESADIAASGGKAVDSPFVYTMQ